MYWQIGYSGHRFFIKLFNLNHRAYWGRELIKMENRQSCICCGYFTIEGEFDLCPVCYWEKDFFQEENIDDSGGANLVSLRTGRENFKKIGAVEEKFRDQVRLSCKEEMTG